jgi:hypothetical protein
MQDMNALYFAVSMDPEFLHKSLAPVLPGDSFTRRLISIYDRVMKAGLKQTKVLQIQRSDYMIDTALDGKGQLKQVT